MAWAGLGRAQLSGGADFHQGHPPDTATVQAFIYSGYRYKDAIIITYFEQSVLDTSVTYLYLILQKVSKPLVLMLAVCRLSPG